MNSGPSFKILLLSGTGILAIGGLVILVSFVNTIVHEGYTLGDICFYDACIEQAADNFSGLISIVVATLEVTFLLATVGGIMIALRNYTNAVESTALSNHIGHFELFQNYVNREIGRHQHINSNSIDIFRWYNLMFNESRMGRTNVSDEYRVFLQKINETITKSNSQAKTFEKATFRYKAHQGRMISALEKIGIIIERMPRNNFYNIEDEILRLVDNVNAAFCYGASLPNMLNREYV